MTLSRLFLPRLWSFLAAGAASMSFAQSAGAHSAERGIVLLLPTQYYIAGGTLAVALTFLLLLFVPARLFRCLVHWRKRLGQWPGLPPGICSGMSFAILILLLIAGFTGSHDPLGNPLPLTIWTLFWVGLTILQALLGDIWALINPWRAPCQLVLWLLGGKASDEPPMRYPAWLGYWPAVIGFLAFGWFELIDVAPADPERLAIAVATYSAVTVAGTLLFGERDWLSRAECFSVFLGFIARMSPLQRPARTSRALAFPGATLAGAQPLPLSGVLFVLLTLSTVSFDGFSRTFWWLDLGGVNPLDFPGRSAMTAQNSGGFLAMWAALSAGYMLAVRLGRRLAGAAADDGAAAGLLVLSILPISLGYHFAHYLTTLMVNGQYAILVLNDPFAAGWNLLGLQGRHVIVSFLVDFDTVAIIWKLQAAAVVGGHVLAVAIAHMIAIERFGATRAAFLSQIPLAALMVAYTLFGLWLLAAPAAA